MALEIVPASMNLLEDYGSYIKECFESGIDHYEEDLINPEKSLCSVIDAASGRNLPEGWEPYKTFFAIKGSKILGAIRYRLGDNDFIRTHIGHIGYETRPSERGKGIAKALLKYIVDFELKDTALVTCDVDNIASVKVIESVPNKPVGSNENVEYVNTTKLKFYVEPAA